MQMNIDSNQPRQQPTPLLSVDLRSDTVTKPTAAMYELMRIAPLGDDGLDGDPTVLQLEAMVAKTLGKAAGLFVPSATMGNLLATLAQAQRQEQVVLESTAHMYTSERGAATFTNLFYLGLPGQNGAMNLEQLEDCLHPGSNKLRTALVCMETSHNNAAGAVLPLEHMRMVYTMARHRGISVHLDGARLFNAAVALDVPPAEITRFTDTVSLCLSKGLSAPVGAVLAGPQETINAARRLRKMIGGSQRQAGVVAAAGIEAVQTMGERLKEDHVRALRLSDALNKPSSLLTATIPQTNIVQVDVSRTDRDSAQWSADLERAGVKVRPWGKHRLRCVTHRHIGDREIQLAIDAFIAVEQR